MKRPAATLLLVATAMLLLGVKRPNGLSDVVEVRHWSYADYTRVVVETTKAVEVKTPIRHLGANNAAKRPERLYVDLGGLWVGRRFVDGIELGDGLLRGVRLGQNTVETTRLVLDLQHYARHRLFTLEHPHRVVIDVFGHARPSFPETPESRLRTGQRPVRTVMLDPGHGGRDPGAIGIGGVTEKKVTLTIAKALGSELEERGFRVLYTRENDRTISLEERTAIAEAARADLFVSIHANSAPRRSVQGVETYYLDKNHERHSLRVAARENGVSREQVDDLQRILAKLRVGELSTYSRELARLVQSEVVNGLPGRYGVNDLGVKKGPFYVLFLSDTPAILIEAGFVTNRTEAKLLADEKYIGAFARQVAAGLTRYRDNSATMAQRSAL